MSTAIAPGIGPARAALLARLGIRDRRDLLFNAPRGWRDLARVEDLAGLVPGREALVRARLLRVGRPFRLRGGRTVVCGVFGEEERGKALAVTWFNAPYAARSLRVGDAYLVFGKVEGTRRLSMTNPEIERAGPDGRASIHAGRIVPLYRATEGLSQKTIRRAVWEALAEVPPEWDWPWPGGRPLAGLLRALHFPEDRAEAESARRALAERECFLLQAAVLRDSARDAARRARPLPCSEALDRRIRGRFPYSFTGGQDRAVREIVSDLARERPMRRLLMGDVGSGKTAVALYACLLAAANRRQAAFLAPTTVLARQHMEGFSRILAGSRVRVALLAGGEAGRAEALRAIARGTVDLVVGTHALLDEKVRFHDLALLVVDEQHRFGVRQRGRLAALDDPAPHVLAMTATPIPRTLAIVLCGGLDVSAMRERPSGRAPVRTLWVRPRAAARRAAFAEIRRRVAAGERAYVVCPAIEGEAAEGPRAVRSVSEVARRLARGAFRGIPIETAHGRLPPERRARALARFARGEARVLVATSLVEVGIDVPEATLMVVADADRFGLAQLHQLRGRVGRGARAGRCWLFADPRTPEGAERLAALETCHDGFALAEKDLSLRGPGEWMGTLQSGLSRFFRAFDPSRDGDLAREARLRAEAWAREAAAWPAGMEEELAARLSLCGEPLSPPAPPRGLPRPNRL